MTEIHFQRWHNILLHRKLINLVVHSIVVNFMVRPTKADTSPPPTPTNDGNPTIIPTEDLLAPDIVHTFLIRDPQKAVPSYYRLCSGEKSKLTGFEYFDPEEVGLNELRFALLCLSFVKL